MCRFVEGPPQFERRGGVVYSFDPGTPPDEGRAMLLGDFVIAAKTANRLARQWVAEANEPDRVSAFKGVEAVERGHL